MSPRSMQRYTHARVHNECVRRRRFEIGSRYPTMATITFLDGSSIAVDANQTVAEARRTLTPPDKKYAPLNLYIGKEGAALDGGNMLGARILRGVWEGVERPRLS